MHHTKYFFFIAVRHSRREDAPEFDIPIGNKEKSESVRNKQNTKMDTFIATEKASVVKSIVIDIILSDR
jgi:hypothetical protein